MNKNELSVSETVEYYKDNNPARRRALFAICLGTMLGPFALASVNLALPTIALALKANAVIVSWMPTGFLLSSVMLMLPMGSLADRYGRKRFYFWGVLSTGILSVAASFGQTMEWLLFCRVLQGISMAMVFGSGMAIVTSIYPANKRGAAMGLYSASVYVALTLSPVLGGWITELLGWRSVFWIPAPISFVVVVLLFGIKGEWKNTLAIPFDWTGSLIFACWAGSLVYGLAGLPKVDSILTLLLSGAFMWLFIYHQNRIKHPLIRPKMFMESRIFSFSLMAASLMYAASYPCIFLLSLYLQLALGYSPIEAGNFMLLQPMMMAILAPFAGRLSDRFEARLISTIGCMLMAMGFFQISRVTYDGNTTSLIMGLLLVGLGFGFFTTPNNNAAMGSIKKSELGIGAASVNLARTIGNMVGISLVGLLIYNLIGASEFDAGNVHELAKMVRIWMFVSIGFALVSAVFSFSRGKMSRESPH